MELPTQTLREEEPGGGQACSEPSSQASRSAGPTLASPTSLCPLLAPCFLPIHPYRTVIIQAS